MKIKEFTCIALIFTYSCLAQSADLVGLVKDFSVKAGAQYHILDEYPLQKLCIEDLKIAGDVLKYTRTLLEMCRPDTPRCAEVRRCEGKRCESKQYDSQPI